MWRRNGPKLRVEIGGGPQAGPPSGVSFLCRFKLYSVPLFYLGHEAQGKTQLSSSARRTNPILLVRYLVVCRHALGNRYTGTVQTISERLCTHSGGGSLATLGYSRQPLFSYRGSRGCCTVHDNTVGTVRVGLTEARLAVCSNGEPLLSGRHVLAG